GFASILEVIITSIIFLIAAYGVLNTISMLRPNSAESARKLEAAYIGKQIIEDLRNNIDASIWVSGSNLDVGIYNQTVAGTYTTYTVNYVISEVPGYPAGEGPRQLIMNITYPDI
ncbi:MAG: hypothetical protein KC733_07675, partial [Candidatus Omnitrophica bacterium]|nr:hypothetical protein [Candidatus Omnitrophota bacterium]